MDDKIQKIKKKIKRLVGDPTLNCSEKYDLVKKQSKELSDVEFKILLKEYKREYKSYDRLKDIKDILAMFLTGIGLLFTMGGSAFIAAERVFVEMETLIVMTTIYILSIVLMLCGVQMWRTTNMNRIQYTLDILEE